MTLPLAKAASSPVSRSRLPSGSMSWPPTPPNTARSRVSPATSRSRRASRRERTATSSAWCGRRMADQRWTLRQSSAKSGVSRRSWTSRRIRSPSGRYGSSAVSTRDAKLAQFQFSAIRALWGDAERLKAGPKRFDALGRRSRLGGAPLSEDLHDGKQVPGLDQARRQSGR